MHLTASANSPGTFCDKARVFVITFNLPLLVSVIIRVLVEPSSQQTADGCRKLVTCFTQGVAHKGSQEESLESSS